MPRKMSKKQSLFFEPSNERLSKIISLKSPKEAKESVRKLKQGYFTDSEKRAINLAANRAGAQLERPNLSSKERQEFKKIKKIYRNAL